MTSEWLKAKCSADNGCTEVKFEGERVYVRSSMNHQLVTFTEEEWNSFKEAIKEGQFDR